MRAPLVKSDCVTEPGTMTGGLPPGLGYVQGELGQKALNKFDVSSALRVHVITSAIELVMKEVAADI